MIVIYYVENSNNVNNLKESQFISKNELFKSAINNVATKNEENIDKNLQIYQNFFEKCNEYYTEARHKVQFKLYNESLNLLDKTETGLVKLNSIISDKKEHYIPKIQKSVDDFLIMIKNYREHVNKGYQKYEKEQQKEKEKIRQSYCNSQPNFIPSKIAEKNYYPSKSVVQFNTVNSNNNNQKLENKQDQKKEEDKTDQYIIDKIRNEIMEVKPNISFDDIIGLNNVKQMLQEIIIIPKLRPDIFTGLRSPPRGILLFGPPGTGKTLLAKAVAKECDCTFFSISAAALTSKYVGESEKLVKALFTLAYKHQPSIIFIDEIESILSKRQDNENESSKRLKTEFLVQFDGVNTNLNDQLLVIGATNRPFDLDSAVLRRLPKRVYIGPLNVQERADFIKTIISNIEHCLSDEDIFHISKKTEMYSNSDLKELCREAAYEPIREMELKLIKTISKLRKINVNDFIKACTRVRGTLSSTIIKELEDWNSEYGALY